MNTLTYKDFVWPRNPHTYKEEGIRKPHYITVDHETYYEGMGEMQRIITGEGVFFGDTADNDIQRLIRVFEEGDPGDLEYPLWGKRYCYFTGLELIQEPKENCVSYRFQFTQALTNGEVPF